MSRFIDITGHRFGRLIVIQSANIDARRNKLWLCRCDCGNEKIIGGTNLQWGRIESCGCLRIERVIQAARTHGASKTPEHDAWISMLQRCNNPKNPAFKHYGGRRNRSMRTLASI